eukprot:Sspe_Gene.82846::Locus_54315_Transcript_2_2_Confidence_0.667_Length_2179::g.82846::m.82846
MPTSHPLHNTPVRHVPQSPAAVIHSSETWKGDDSFRNQLRVEAALRAELDDLRLRTRAQQEQSEALIDELRLLITSQEHDRVRLENELRSAQQRVNMQESEISTASDRLASTNEAVSLTRAELSRSRAVEAELIRKLDEMQSRDDQGDESTRKTNELTHRLREIQALYESSEATCQLLRGEITMLKGDLAELRDVSMELAVSRRELEAAKGALEGQSRTAEYLENETARLRSQLAQQEEETAKRAREVMDLQNDLCHSATEAATLAQRVATAEAQAERRATQVSIAEMKLKEATVQFLDMQQKYRLLAKAEAEARALADQLRDELECASGKLEADRATWEGQMREREEELLTKASGDAQRMAELQAVRSRLAEVEQTLAEAVDKCRVEADRRRELEGELERHRAEWEEDCTTLTRDLEAARCRSEEFKAKAVKLEEELGAAVKALGMQSESAEAEKHVMESRLEEAVQEVKELMATTQELQASLLAADQRMRDAEASHSGELHRLESEVEALRRALREAQEVEGELREKVDAAGQYKDEAEGTGKLLAEAIAKERSASRRVADLESELARAQAQLWRRGRQVESGAEVKSSRVRMVKTFELLRRNAVERRRARRVTDLQHVALLKLEEANQRRVLEKYFVSRLQRRREACCLEQRARSLVLRRYYCALQTRQATGLAFRMGKRLGAEAGRAEHTEQARQEGEEIGRRVG